MSWKDYYTQITGNPAPSSATNPHTTSAQQNTPTRTLPLQGTYLSPSTTTSHDNFNNHPSTAAVDRAGAIVNDKTESKKKTGLDKNILASIYTGGNPYAAGVVQQGMGETNYDQGLTFYNPAKKTTAPKTSDLRARLIAEIKGIDDRAAYVSTVEQSDALDSERREILDQLHEEDARLGNNPRSYDARERVGNIVSGSLEQVGSAYTNFLGTMKGLGNRLVESSNDYDQKIAASPYSGWATDELSAGNIASGMTEEDVQRGMNEMLEDEQRLYNKADDLLASSSLRLNTAKEGLGSLGQFGVDIASNMIQMGADAAGSAAGLGMVPFFIRAAGGSMQEARHNGASTSEQFLYGITEGAIEVATEKLFDGVAGLFGKGAADEIVESVIGKLAKSDTGRTVLRAVSGAAGEGTEEVISDFLTPFAQMIYNNETLFDTFRNLPASASDMLYDFLVGSAMGAAGFVGSIATGQNAQKNSTLSAVEATTPQAAQQAAQNVQGDIQTPPSMQNATTVDSQRFNAQGSATADAGQNNTAPQGADVRSTARIIEGKEDQQSAISDAYDMTVLGGRSVEIPTEALNRYRDSTTGNPIENLITAVKAYYDTSLKGTKVDVQMNGGVLEVKFENDGKKKSVGWRMNPDKAATFERLHQLFENAEYAYSEQNRNVNERGSVPLFHYFVADAVINGEHIPVKLQVRDLVNEAGTESRYYTHNFPQNKNGSHSPGTDNKNAVNVSVTPTLPNSSIPNSPQNVNGNLREQSYTNPDTAAVDGVTSSQIGSAIQAAMNTKVMVKGKEYGVNDIVDYVSWLSYKYGEDTYNGVISYLTQRQGWPKARTMELLGAAQACGAVTINHRGQIKVTTEKAVSLYNRYVAGPAAVAESLQTQNNTTGRNANVAKYSTAANEAFNAAIAQQVRIDDIASKISEALGVPYSPGKQKSVNSIISRLSRNEARGRGSDWHDLKDLARTHIEMKSWDDIPRVLSMLDEMGIPYTASAKNTKLGYKGVHITWYENGVGHELQLSTPEAWAIKQKTEEIYEKWRDLEADHNFVRPTEYYSDIAQSKEMWNQLNLPDFSRFATSSGVSNLASSSKSSPRNMLERSLPQLPSANSASGLPGSSFIMRPDSVNITSTEKTSNNAVSSAPIIPSSPQNVNTQGETNMRERGFSENIRTDTAMEPGFRQVFEDEPLMYEQLSNKDTLAKAQAIFNRGFDEARDELREAIGKAKKGYKLSPEMVPLAKMVANELYRQGNPEEATRIASDIGLELMAAGQLGQANIILRNASPVTVLETIQKAIDRINEEPAVKRGKWEAKLTKEEIDLISSTDFSEGSLEEVYKQIADRLGEEMPASLWEKLKEIRRVNMLLRPRTQIKNIAGNVPMLVMRKAANELSGAIQDALVKTGAINKADQTRTSRVTKESREIAKQAYEQHKASLQQEANKWDMNSLLRDHRTYFKSKLGKATYENARQLTYKLLEAGDSPFVRSAFQDSIAQYCSAHNITDISLIPHAAVEKAQQDAFDATFKSTSTLANSINALKRKGGPAAEVLDVLFPFTTTPINIVNQLLEYSPAGFVKAINQVYSKNSVEAVDSFSRATIGSVAIGLGALLRALGVITGGEDDDKGKAAFDKATGNSPYSFGGVLSYDWAQPAGSLLALGADIYESVKDDKSVADAMLNALITASDSVLNLSVFSNIVSVLQSGYGSPTEKVLKNVVESFASQMTPGIVGDIAKIADPTVRSTYTGGDMYQNMLARLESNVPGISKFLPASVNVKGEDISRGNWAARAFNTLINPGNVNTGQKTEYDAALEKIYAETGNKNVFMEPAPYSVTIDSKNFILTGEERSQFQRTMGQAYYGKYLPQAIDSGIFESLSGEQKVKVLQDLQAQAKYDAMAELAANKGEEYDSDLDDEAALSDIPAYYSYKEVLGGAAGRKSDVNYLTVDGLLRRYGVLPADVKKELEADGNLHINSLIYAASKDIGSEKWYKDRDAIKAARKEAGSSDVSQALAVWNNTAGTTDYKMRAIESQLTPEDGGMVNSTVRRMNAYNGFCSKYDIEPNMNDWCKIMAAFKDYTTSSTISSEKAKAAWSEKLGLRYDQTFAGLSFSNARNIFNKYYQDASYSDQFDEEYATDHPEKEKSQSDIYGWFTGQDTTQTGQQSQNEAQPYSDWLNAVTGKNTAPVMQKLDYNTLMQMARG